MSFCNVCPRSCKVDRKQSIHEKGRAGYWRPFTTGKSPVSVEPVELVQYSLPGVTCPVYIARIMRYLN